MPDENITKTQLAINILQEALFEQGRYLIQDIDYQDKSILEENDSHVTKLVALLEKIELARQDYTKVRKGESWRDYIMHTAVSSKAYVDSQNKEQEIQKEIEKIQQEYIEHTQEQDALDTVNQLKLPDHINIESITPIIKQQINYMEEMITEYDRWRANKYCFNIPSSNISDKDKKAAHQEEKDLIDQYKDLLQESVRTDVRNMLQNMLPQAADNSQQETFNKLIKTFSDNGNIKLLLNNYAYLYAKKIFCEINQKLYSNFGAIELANTNIKFFKAELDNAIAEQRLFSTKINLLCQQIIQDKYIIKNDTENTQHLEQIIKDIEQLTPKDINDFTKKAEDTFKMIANHSFLTKEQQEQFINKFVFIEYQTVLNKRKGIETALIEQKIKSLVEETNKQIQAAIVAASNTPQPLTINSPKNLVQQITGGWSTEPIVSSVNPASNQNVTDPFFDEATEIYNKISGVSRLSQDQKMIFTKQIAFKLGGLKLDNDKQWLVKKAWNSITSVISSSPGVPQSINDEIEIIQTAIHATFAETPKMSDKIRKFQQEIYLTTEIKDKKLQTKLEQDLANVLINFKKQKFNISPIPAFDNQESKEDHNAALKTRLDNIVNRIETAKILTEINSFADIPLEQQLIYIDQINNHLMTISQLNKQRSALKDNSNNTPNAEKIIIINQNIQRAQKTIKEIIINIDLYSKQFTKLRTDFSITEDSTNIVQSITNILSTDTVTNALTGAGMGVACAATASVLGGFFSNIPIIGSFIAPVANGLSSFNILAAGLTGGIIGTKLPLRKIFKPFRYLVDEISDVVKNPQNNSTGNRVVRGLVILATCTATLAVTGLAIFAMANPISGPIIASVGVGALTLVAGFAVSSLCVWGTNKILKTIKEYDAYNEKLAYDFCASQNNTKSQEDIKMDAKQLSMFFEEHIKEYNNKLKNFKAQSLSNDLEKVDIQKILSMLQQAWKNITENKDPEWDNLLKVLYYDKKYGYQKELKEHIKIADDVTNRLIELVDTPKCVKSRELDATQLANIKQKQQAAISFKENTVKQLNNFIEKPNKELEQLYTISNIIKKRNN